MLYYLSLGANLGDREQTIKQALELIEQQVGHVLRCSSFFYSVPWGFESENEFCNLCCAVKSSQDPLSVLRLTQTIERALGRNNKSQIINHKSVYKDRKIDIDLIRAFDDSGNEIKCQNNQMVNDQMVNVLTLPHPLWQERDFVKIPLAEIMP